MMGGGGHPTVATGGVPIAIADRLFNERNEAIELVEELHGKLKDWRVYANRLNAHIAAHKQSEYALIEAMKTLSDQHHLASIDGLKEMFDRHLAYQYSLFDSNPGTTSPAEQKSISEVGKGREAII